MPEASNGKFAFMRKLAKLFIAAACLATMLGVAAEKEPRYKGRSLSYWIGELPNTNEALTAIHTMGTNCIPICLEWISYQRSALERKFPGRSRWLTADDAVIVFGWLGDQARPAIPKLTKLAMKSSDPDRAERCIEALGHIGPAAFTNYLDILANGPPVVRAEALNHLFTFPDLAVDALPVAVESLGDPDLRVRKAAHEILMLSQVSLPTPVVVPAVTNGLIRHGHSRARGPHMLPTSEEPPEPSLH